MVRYFFFNFGIFLFSLILHTWLKDIVGLGPGTNTSVLLFTIVPKSHRVPPFYSPTVMGHQIRNQVQSFFGPMVKAILALHFRRSDPARILLTQLSRHEI